MIYAPVVLDIGRPRYVVPKTLILDCKFLIRLRISKDEVREVVASEGTVKAESTLGLTKQILDFLVESPASTYLELVRSLGPRNIVANLVVVGLIDPRPTRYFKVCAGGTVQVDIWDAVQV